MIRRKFRLISFEPEMLKESFRFLNWPVKVNTLIFRNLDSANITYIIERIKPGGF
jgi:phosphotransacetylase